MKVHVHTDFETPLSPDGVIATLTDFSARRPELWPDLDPAEYQVHEVKGACAVVTEGNRRPDVWARERYDWSQPGRVSWRAEESNFSAPGSSVRVMVAPGVGGGSHVEVDWDRSPRGVKGYMIVGAMGVIGKRRLKSGYKQVFDRVARSSVTDAATSSTGAL